MTDDMREEIIARYSHALSMAADHSTGDLKNVLRYLKTTVYAFTANGACMPLNSNIGPTLQTIYSAMGSVGNSTARREALRESLLTAMDCHKKLVSNQ